MPYRTRSFTCEDCGMPMIKRKAPHATIRCIQCSIAAAQTAAWQMHERKGPYYDRFLVARAAAALKALNDSRLAGLPIVR